MARPRQFDRDKALLQAINVFCDKGFAAASTDELMQAMSLSRQSMYNTFGDKRQLYVEAMTRYQAKSINDLITRLSLNSSPMESLRNMLMSFASRTESEGSSGCMAVNAICEFGLSDDELNQLNVNAGRKLHDALADTLKRAMDLDEVPATMDISSACDFLLSMLNGMKVSAKAGIGADRLMAVADIAVEALKS